MATSLLLRRISKLAGIQPEGILRLKGSEMANLQCIPDAFLLIENDRIKSFGPDSECTIEHADQIIDCSGKIVLPSFCDSHTHLVFAEWRTNEFVDRIKGLSYEEIAQRGGGILHSASKLQAADETQLFEQAKNRLSDVIALGTGAIEIKSGYGLTPESEIKILRVIRKLKELNWIPVKSTFLGAHALPKNYQHNREGYIKLIIEDMLPIIRDEGLADFIDVFCDRGFFTLNETETILEAGDKIGLKPKIHANELDYSGGIQMGVKHHAVSVDHLEFTGPDEISALAASSTIATLLPSTAFFLGLPYAPARNILDHDICVALASDFNPGSSPSGNMSFILSLACIKMKMLPEEAINATILNGAAAMELSSQLGSITPSKSANLMITKKVTGINELPYSFGVPLIDQVIIAGELL